MATFSLLIILVYYMHITFAQVVVTEIGHKQYKVEINGVTVCPSTVSVTISKPGETLPPVDLSTVRTARLRAARITRLLVSNKMNTVRCGTESGTKSLDLDLLERRTETAPLRHHFHAQEAFAQQAVEEEHAGGEGEQPVSDPAAIMSKEYRALLRSVQDPEGYETQQKERWALEIDPRRSARWFSKMSKKMPTLLHYLADQSFRRYNEFVQENAISDPASKKKIIEHIQTPDERDAIWLDFQRLKYQYALTATIAALQKSSPQDPAPAAEQRSSPYSGVDVADYFYIMLWSVTMMIMTVFMCCCVVFALALYGLLFMKRMEKAKKKTEVFGNDIEQSIE